MTADLWAHRFEDLWYPDLLAWTVLLNAAYLLLVNLWRRAFNWDRRCPSGGRFSSAWASGPST